jgi:hypothetical protein
MTKKTMPKFMAMLCLGMLLAGAWFLSSASLFVIKNRSPHQLTHVEWYTDAKDRYTFVVLLRGHRQESVIVELKFSDGVIISEEIGYFTAGDILLGYHELKILKNKCLDYSTFDWL